MKIVCLSHGYGVQALLFCSIVFVCAAFEGPFEVIVSSAA